MTDGSPPDAEVKALPAPAATAPARRRPAAVRLTGGWPLGRTIGIGVAIAALLSVLGIIVGGAAGVAIALLLVVVVFALGLWRSVILPLSRLAADARQVAGGDFSHQVGSPGGPAEVRAVGMDVDLMRKRILAELSAVRAAHASLEARTEDLQRSNAELEQFAYLASHDLQEPLRKVASFCQLLQRRYAGKLDARADQYIEFAVDGAKRMQALINDLLAFSRVGQTPVQPALVSSDTALAQARANLADEIEKSGATIEAGHLPLVLAELPLLTAVFQNLLSNAVKFNGPAPPRIVVSARRDGRQWLFSVTDYGIGIEPQYADRIFLLFQRLNERSAYPGTGVGLALCRKIIEYFGGRIWLDTEAASNLPGPTAAASNLPGPTAAAGTRFCFTLPGEEDDE